MIGKLKQCAGCGELKPIWKNYEGEKFCRDCWYKKEPTKFPKQRTPLKGKSDKQSVLDVAYTMLRKKFVAKNPYCQARIAGCTTHTTDVHHKRGRGKYYLDDTTWLAVCRACHAYIETHPTEAKELGFSISRTSKADDNDT